MYLRIEGGGGGEIALPNAVYLKVGERGRKGSEGKE